jgi:aerobic-type carbon monoxide dehydrogenase small subunit (CoxS/CutS family)
MCTGYVNIVKAVLEAAQKIRNGERAASAERAANE